MRRSVPCLPVLLFVLSLAAPIDAQTVLARGVVANGGGETSGPYHTSIGTAGQACIGVVSGPGTIHEVGFWYPFPSDPSGLTEEEDGLPTRFSLTIAQLNTPGHLVHIRYAVPERSFVAIKLFDVSGRQIRSLVDGELDPGHHEVQLTTRGLPSGIYFCRMTAEQFTKTKRLALLR